MAEDKNEIVKEAAVEYEYLTGEEDIQRIAFLKRKFELDYNTGIEDAEERGMEKGLKKGIQKGIKQGKQEGMKEKTIKIAKKMIEMQMDIKTISEATELSVEEIEKLK